MLKNGTIFGQPQNKIGRNITIWTENYKY
jgi:hypothetical protein